MGLTCKQCGVTLTGVPEPDHHEWFIRCLVCGAKNVVATILHVIGRQIVSASVQIVGWRD